MLDIQDAYIADPRRACSHAYREPREPRALDSQGAYIADLSTEQIPGGHMQRTDSTLIRSARLRAERKSKEQTGGSDT